MKIVAWLLLFFGICNIIAAITTFSSASSQYQSKGVEAIFMGLLFLGGAVLCFYKVKQREQEKKEKEEWLNKKDEN